MPKTFAKTNLGRSVGRSPFRRAFSAWHFVQDGYSGEEGLMGACCRLGRRPTLNGGACRAPGQEAQLVISKHLRNIFLEDELEPESVCANFARTAADGKTYKTLHYNLNAIISVGFRVNSRRGTQFRQWATRVLRDHLRGLGTGSCPPGAQRPQAFKHELMTPDEQ